MPFWTPRFSVVAAAMVTAACGGLGNEPPTPPPVIKGPDGQRRHVVEHGRYKAFYDRWGRLERIDHDSNGDGRPDRVLRHDGRKTPHRVEIDGDFDGAMDRYDEFTPEGKLGRYSVLENGRARRWTVVGEDEKTSLRYEYDEDGDGRTERAEVVLGGRIGRVELDTDRNGRVDRWQDWEAGRMSLESVDTDGDGRPDRHLRYGPDGRLRHVERPVS